MSSKTITKLVTVAVTAITILTLAAPVNALGYSGRPVLFHSNRDGDNEIYLTQQNGQISQLTNNTTLQDESPTWRPQGDSFVYVSYVANTTAAQLHSFELASGSIKQLTNNSNFVHTMPSYSPDGKKIVFITRDAASQTCIKTMVVATMAQTTLLCADASRREAVELPVWSPDGKLIMYTKFGGQIDRYVYNIQSGTSTLLIPGAYTGVWSPNGAKIAFSRLRGPGIDTEQVFLANADGTNEQQITSSGSDPTRSRRAVAWYPDGNTLLIMSFAAPDFLPELRSLRLSDLQEQILPHKAGTSDFASPTAVKP